MFERVDFIRDFEHGGKLPLSSAVSTLLKNQLVCWQAPLRFLQVLLVSQVDTFKSILLLTYFL